MEYRIIDLYQEEINNWNAVKFDESIFGVILHYEKDNKNFKEYMGQCTRLKIPFGISIKSKAIDLHEAENEAKFVESLIKDYKLEMPIYYNIVNRNDIKDPKLLGAIVKVFTQTLKNNNYYTAMYIDIDTFKKLPKVFYDYDKWITVLDKGQIFYSRYSMVENKNKKTYPWANEPIKTNTCFVNYPEIIKFNRLNGFEPFIK